MVSPLPIPIALGMPYATLLMKWQLRNDLTGRYATNDLDIATERARGWNACRDEIKRRLKEEGVKEDAGDEGEK